MPTNLRPTIASAKKSILAFAKSLVSPKIYRALELILSPCCKYFFTAVTAVCDPDNPGNYIVTITLNQPLNLNSLGTARLMLGGRTVGYASWQDGTTQSFSNIPASPGPQNIGLDLFYLPNTAEGNYNGLVFLISTDISPIDEPVFPTC